LYRRPHSSCRSSSTLSSLPPPPPPPPPSLPSGSGFLGSCDENFCWMGHIIVSLAQKYDCVMISHYVE
jgi:hypothetical protein